MIVLDKGVALLFRDSGSGISPLKAIAREIAFVDELRGTLYDDRRCGVVLCPPHPLYGGARDDPRLVSIAEELSRHNISALCMDYGRDNPVQNVLSAISYMKGRVKLLGLLGYSYGAVCASIAAVHQAVEGLVVMSILKRVNGLKANLNTRCPKLFIHGKNDILAPYKDFEELYSKAKGKKEKFILGTDHFYLGQVEVVSKRVGEFFARVFSESSSEGGV